MVWKVGVRRHRSSMTICGPIIVGVLLVALGVWTWGCMTCDEEKSFPL